MLDKLTQYTDDDRKIHVITILMIFGSNPFGLQKLSGV